MASTVESSISQFKRENESDPAFGTLWIFEKELVDNIQNCSHVCDNIPSSESFKVEGSV
jgi:hypothetical protein